MAAHQAPHPWDSPDKCGAAELFDVLWLVDISFPFYQCLQFMCLLFFLLVFEAEK